MKNVYLLLILIVFSCSDKNPTKHVENQLNKNDLSTTKTANKVETNIDWLNYYQKLDSTFSFKKFKAEKELPLQMLPTVTPAKFENSFNNIYNPFLVYSPDKKQYIDFDSYNWTVTNDGNASFEADQEVILVNLETKTKNRIAFYGPSYRIEDVHWKNNDEAILMGNSSDNVPFFVEINLKRNTLKNFQYSDALKIKSDYQTMRLNENGVATN